MTTGAYREPQLREWFDAVRYRPGMYVGDVENGEGMHHMLWHVIENAVDEHRDGTASYVRVAFDGARVTVDDDGRGIPIEAHAVTGRSLLEMVMTTFMRGADVWGPHAEIRRGMWCGGLPCVCALSSELIAETWRDGHAYVQRFSGGKPLGLVRNVGRATRAGTRITFEPDFTLLRPLPWDVALIHRRARDLAATNPRLTVIADGVAVRCPDGLADHVHAETGAPAALCHLRGRHGGIAVETAFGWTDAAASRIEGLANGVRCDGMHLRGLFGGLRRAVARRVPSVQHIRAPAFRRQIERGMHAAVHVVLDDPRWNSQRRDWLLNPEVRHAVSTVVAIGLEARMADDPALTDALMLSFESRVCGPIVS